jgi:hypothetical protein
VPKVFIASYVVQHVLLFLTPRFYMTTKLRNPHYPPEVSVKVRANVSSSNACDTHACSGVTNTCLPIARRTCVQVSLLNFFVTPEGLEEQLLGTVVTQVVLCVVVLCVAAWGVGGAITSTIALHQLSASIHPRQLSSLSWHTSWL